MTLRSSALESAALETRRVPPVRPPRRVRDRVRGSGLRAVENSMYDDASAYGARSRSPGAVAGVTGAPPRARAGTTRVTALATANELRNTRQRGTAGLDRTSAARRGGVRCLVDPVRGGVDRRHAPDTHHAPHYEWFIAVHAHTRHAHDPTAKNILSHHRRPSCIHTCIHTCIAPKPPEGQSTRGPAALRAAGATTAALPSSRAQVRNQAQIVVRYFLPLLLPKIRLMGDAWRGLGDAGFALRPGESGRGDAERGDAGRALPLPRPGLSWRAARPGES